MSGELDKVTITNVKNITCQYDEDYYLHGLETGKSLYTNYHWMPELTMPMVQAMIHHLGIDKDDTVLDFGCARGYTVRAFRELGYMAWGRDTSKWAVENCDPAVKLYLSINEQYPAKFDWVIAKDVLEHVGHIVPTVEKLMAAAVKGVFIVVPLAPFDGLPYVVGDYEKDVTHVQRLTLGTWVKMFLRPGWSVEASYRVRGIKDNWWKPQWVKGNGFVTSRRIE